MTPTQYDKQNFWHRINILGDAKHLIYVNLSLKLWPEWKHLGLKEN